MKNFFYILIFSVLLVGCGDPYNIHINGEDYKLVRKGHVDKDGKRNIPLYEKRGNTNNYYTPSLSGDQMISIMK